MAMTKKLFVTVGSTKFDDLISAICDLKSLARLFEIGYKDITLQIGTGTFPEATFDRNTSYAWSDAEFIEDLDNGHSITLNLSIPGPKVPYSVSVMVFRMKPSVQEDMAKADVVVSHAGAGSCVETLALHRPLVTVTNDQLMDKHQTELAQKLASMGACVTCSPVSLVDTLATFDPDSLTPFAPGQPKLLANYLDKKFVCRV